MVGVDGHPDAGLDVDRQPFQHKGVPEAGQKLLGHGRGAVAGLDTREQDRELVAAEAGHGVDLAQGGLEPLADLDQELVAVVVAEGVVDLLEPVQIDQSQRRRDQLAVGLAHRLAGPVVQQGPVGQPGEGVGQGLVLDAALVADQQRPAAEQQPQPQGEHDRDGHQLGPAELPLGSHACRRLFPLVLGAVLQPLGQLQGRRFHRLLLKLVGASGVVGGDGRQRPAGGLPVALQIDADVLGEPDVVGIGMLDDEAKGSLHLPGRPQQVGPGGGPSMVD